MKSTKSFKIEISKHLKPNVLIYIGVGNHISYTSFTPMNHSREKYKFIEEFPLKIDCMLFDTFADIFIT